MKKYSMVQMNTELHNELKRYCIDNGYTISGLVERLVKNEIRKPKIDPDKVLRTHPVMKKHY